MDEILEVSQGIKEPLIRRKALVYLEHWERDSLDNIDDFDIRSIPFLVTKSRLLIHRIQWLSFLFNNN